MHRWFEHIPSCLAHYWSIVMKSMPTRWTAGDLLAAMQAFDGQGSGGSAQQTRPQYCYLTEIPQARKAFDQRKTASSGKRPA